MMPRLDGYEFTKIVREGNDSLPILMVSAKHLPKDKQKGFLVGTDDYMTKPFSSDELLWRVNALLRRANINQEKKIVIGSVTVESEKYAVYSDSEYVELPKKEFDLLFKLISYPEQIFSKEQLLDSVWGYNYLGNTRTIDAHIRKVREKCEGISPRWAIRTIWGVGYKFETA
jgi:DNA-binding response OmpR family regulator